MLWLARQRYERTLELAARYHPGSIVIFPKTFKEFEKAPMRPDVGYAYFVRSRGGRQRASGSTCDSDALDDCDQDDVDDVDDPF